jgi:CheY-like chemotaxis protein
MKERRNYRRTPAIRQLEIRPLSTPTRRAPWQLSADEPEAKAPEKNFGHLIDIGCGGMRAVFNHPVEVGIECEVRIHGTSGKIQAERGRVCTLGRGAKGNQVGIAFDDPIVALGDVKRRGPKLAGDYDIRRLAVVVDDEPDVRNTLDRFLTRRGLRVLAAGDANQALAAIEFESPVLMMIDLKMPEFTGIQLLERMYDRNLSVPHIWAMSGYASDEDAMLALELGASAFLNKPFDLDHLDYSLESLALAVAV